MSKISDQILPFINDGEINYSVLNEGRHTMSLKFFEATFKLIAFSELPEIEKYAYYYQSLNDPDLVMFVRVTKEGYSAMLAQYNDPDEHFYHLKSKLGFTINEEL
ncbi:hypothetical protein ACFSKU_08310 [Pontibacter silvestris]|uniref:Uncharacterized protein n=1 Tax=Pontibacter silvestris TaxID=2305183 RepID=A0ABW4WYW4_9BACT|nr:hypothetical protein [Pontibacter silvestris]MCC9137381.1 hypothetical protein [Pontibacter silvestris]